MEKKHFIEIDALKGWAIFLVVLGHAIIIYPLNLHENACCAALFSFVSAFHVRLFFVVSGFCYSFRGSYREYLMKKVKRILIPYFVFCILEMIAKLAFSGQINRPRGLGEFLVRMLFYGGDYWFLWTLFMIFLIYPVIHKLISRSRTVFVLALCFFLILSLLEINVELFEIGRVTMYLFWFSLGVFLKPVWTFDKLPSKQICLVAVIVLAAFILGTQQLTAGKWIPYVFRDTLCGAAGVIGSVLLTKFSWFNKAFSGCGKYSLQLYLCNGLLLGISRTVICSILHVTLPAAIIGFNMLVDFFFSYWMIKYVFSRFRVFRTLMGMV